MSYKVFEIPETRSPGFVDVVVADPSDANSRCFAHYAYTIGSSERHWPRLAERRAIDFSLFRDWQDFQARQPEAVTRLRDGDEYWPGRSALTALGDTHQAQTAMRLGALEILANLFSGRIAANDKDPFPHQLALQQFMRAQQGRLQRILIADEVGLGKTIEIGLVLRDILIARGSLDRFSCLYLTSGGLVEDACTKLRDVMRGSLDGQAVVEAIESFRRYGAGNTRGVHVGSLHAARLYTTVARKASLPSARIAPEIIIIDECHHCASEADLSSERRLQLEDVTRSYQAAFQLVTGSFWPNSEPPKLVVLMSATPFRSRMQFLNLLKLLTHGVRSEQNSQPFNAYEPGANAAKLATVLRRPESSACVVWRQQNDVAVRRWSGGRLFPNLRIVRPHKATDGTPILAPGHPAYLDRMNQIGHAVVRISRKHNVPFGGFAVAQLEKKLTSSSLAGACWLFTWCVRHCEWPTQKEFEGDSSPGTEVLRRLIVEISQRLASFSKNSARHADVIFPSENFTFLASSLARPGRISDIYRYWAQMRESQSEEAKGFIASPGEIVELASHGIALLRPSDVTDGMSGPDDGTESAFGVENSKLNWMLQMLESYPTERFVVFTESLQTCAIITSALPRSGQLVGSMGSEARNDVIGRFRNGHLRVLVATSAADEGIDLQVSNRVVHWDLSTSPAVLMQRNGRVARLGQVADVTAYYLIVTGTHEERRDQVLTDKFTALGIQDESLRLKILGTLQEEEEERLASAIDSNQQVAVGDILVAAKRDNEEMERELKQLRTSLQWHYVLDREALAVRLERWHRLGLPEVVSTELRFTEKKWSKPVFGEVATSEPAAAKIATLESGDLRQRVTFDPEYQVFAAVEAKEFRLAGLRPWTRRDNDTAGFTKLRPDVSVDLVGDLCGKLARLDHSDFSLISASIRSSVPRLGSARWLLFATHPMREAETSEHEGQARYLACYPFGDDLVAPIVPEGLSAEEVDQIIQVLEVEACDPPFMLDEQTRNLAMDVGRRLGEWMTRVRSIGGGAIFDEAKYFLPIPVALVQVVSPGERPALVGGASRLNRSPDPLDRVGSALLRRCLLSSRVTLADAIEIARQQNRPEIEAYAALQRLINPEHTALVRYFVEHNDGGKRLVTAEDVRSRFMQLTESPDVVKDWMATVEVVWSAPSLGGPLGGDDR